MATYLEIRNLFNDSDLRNKVATAVIIAADGILNEVTPSAARKAWANKAFTNPQQEVNRVVMSVLAANQSASVATIQAASDATIQTNVDASIDLFIDADAGV